MEKRENRESDFEELLLKRRAESLLAGFFGCFSPFFFPVKKKRKFLLLFLPCQAITNNKRYPQLFGKKIFFSSSESISSQLLYKNHHQGRAFFFLSLFSLSQPIVFEPVPSGMSCPGFLVYPSTTGLPVVRFLPLSTPLAPNSPTSGTHDVTRGSVTIA